MDRENDLRIISAHHRISKEALIFTFLPPTPMNTNKSCKMRELLEARFLKASLA